MLSKILSQNVKCFILYDNKIPLKMKSIHETTKMIDNPREITSD